MRVLEPRTRRQGAVLEPDGSAVECGGVLNPAAVRARDGALLLYPWTCPDLVDSSG